MKKKKLNNDTHFFYKLHEETNDNKVGIIINAIKKRYYEGAFLHIIRFSLKWVVLLNYNYIRYIYHKFFKYNSEFEFGGKTYNYHYKWYNTWQYDTGIWQSERMVETPIIFDEIKRHKNKKILEVGNVLSHYFTVNHDILDKYEIAIGVINQDIIDFEPTKNYDLIVSISTLEHIGFNEEPQEPEKAILAINRLKSILNDGGKIIVTWPIGYNPYLDGYFRDGQINFTKVKYLKRISINKWVESDWENVRNAEMDNPLPYANGIVIGEIVRRVGKSE